VSAAGPQEWWTDLDAEILAHLEPNRAMQPAELGAKLGMSEAAVNSLLALLACEGKVQIRLVEPSWPRSRGRELVKRSTAPG
jgi:DNA-binding transcriptional regulator LsrR (DeoR family)